MKKTILAIITTLSFQSFASNTDNSFYIGASFLNVDATYKWDENDDNGYDVKVGYFISKYFSVEAGYQDLGTFTWSDKSFEGGGAFDSDAYYLSTITAYPINDFSLYAELGYQWVERKGDIYTMVGINPPFSNEDSSFIVGVGVSYHLTNNVDLNIGYSESSLYSWGSAGLNICF